MEEVDIVNPHCQHHAGEAMGLLLPGRLASQSGVGGTLNHARKGNYSNKAFRY